MSDLNDCASMIVKDAFEVLSITYDAEFEIDYNTNIVTIRAVGPDGGEAASVAFHRYEDVPILALSKMAMGDLAELSGLPHRGSRLARKIMEETRL